jgi:CBS domain-containing protein
MRRVEWLGKRCDPKTLWAHQLMEDHLVTCQPTDSALTAAHKLYEGSCGSVPVVDNDHALLGLVSEYDLLCLMEAEKDLRNIPVSEIMIREVVTITEDTPFLDILRLLQKDHLLRLPVLSGRTLKGILARRDIVLGYIKATDVGAGGS